MSGDLIKTLKILTSREKISGGKTRIFPKIYFRFFYGFVVLRFE